MKRFILFFAVTWMTAIFSAGPLWAIDLSFYEKCKNGSELDLLLLKTHINGVGQGYGGANSELVVRRNQPPLFCVPKNLAITVEQSMDIIDREINEDRYYKDYNSPIEYILLRGLIRTFPCGGK